MALINHSKAVAVGLALAAAATTVSAQDAGTVSSRRTATPTPAVQPAAQQTQAPIEDGAVQQTSNAALDAQGSVRHAVHGQPAPALRRSSTTKPGARPNPAAQEPASQVVQTRAVKSQVQSEVEAGDFQADAAPSAGGHGQAAPGDAMHGKHPVKAGPTNYNGSGPYVALRAQYHWQKVKYRWQHYWKPGLQEHHWGYPEEFCEKPLGYYVYAHNRTMVANAEAGRMMLYEYDFELGEAKLNPRGREQLAKIAMLLPQNFFPVVIAQSNVDPDLADKRRDAVLALLQQSGFPIPDQRVVVSSPIARGAGFEAEHYGDSLNQSYQTGGQSSGGPAPGTTAQGTGASSGGGGGGGGTN